MIKRKLSREEKIEKCLKFLVRNVPLQEVVMYYLSSPEGISNLMASLLIELKKSGAIKNSD